MCVCLPSFYSTNEREREERFPFRKSGDKGEALNAETPEGKLQNLPTQGKFLVSLNPSNCSPARCWRLSQRLSHSRWTSSSWLSGPVGVGAKEREGLYLRTFQSIWGQEVLTKQRKPISILQQKPWSQPVRFCFRVWHTSAVRPWASPFPLLGFDFQVWKVKVSKHVTSGLLSSLNL